MPCMPAAGELQPGHASARCCGAVRAPLQRRPDAFCARARSGSGLVPAHAARGGCAAAGALSRAWVGKCRVFIKGLGNFVSTVCDSGAHVAARAACVALSMARGAFRIVTCVCSLHLCVIGVPVSLQTARVVRNTACWSTSQNLHHSANSRLYECCMTWSDRHANWQY